MADERVLSAKLKFSGDGIDEMRSWLADAKERANRLEHELKELGQTGPDALKRTEQAARNVRRAFVDLHESGERLSSLGMRIGAVGAAIGGPLILAANQYIQRAGIAESASRRWLAATDRMARSQERVGRVVVEQAGPYLEKLADLAEKAARFAEQHPEAVKAALGIAGSAATLGGAVMAAGQVVNAIGTVGLLLSKLGIVGAAAGGAAKGAGGAAAAGGFGILGPILGGLGIGYVGAKALGYQGGVVDAAKDLLKFPLQIVSSGVGLATAGLRNLGVISDDTAQSVGQVIAAIGNLGETSEEAAQQIDQPATGTAIPQAAIDTFAAYQRANTLAVQQYEQARNEIIRRYGEDRVSLEADHEQARNRIIDDFREQQNQAAQDFQRSQARLARAFDQRRGDQMRDFLRQQIEDEERYYQDRAERIANAGLESRRAEEDHQREMMRIREDYAIQQEDAIAARDAMAFLRNARDYEIRRRREEEDYATEAARRNEDTARTLADMEAAFAKQRAKRQEEFALQLADQQMQYEQQRADAEADYVQGRDRELQEHNERLAEMDAEHQERMDKLDFQKNQDLQKLNEKWDAERTARDDAFREQLFQLDQALNKEGETRQQYYERMEADYKAWLGRMAAATPPGGGIPRQQGGYAAAGLYRLGESGREFVLNATATRNAEMLTGGLLSQDSVLAMLAAGRGAASNFNQTVNIGTQDTYAGLLSAIRDQTISLLNEYARA